MLSGKAAIQAIPNVSQDAISFPILHGFRAIGISTVTGYQLIESGELPTFKIGRRRYVSKEALQRFVEKRLAQSLDERSEDRGKQVEKAVQGRAKRREERQAA